MNIAGIFLSGYLAIRKLKSSGNIIQAFINYCFFFHDNEVKLYRLLQFVEAYVLLDFVAKEIKLRRPDMPLFSIHDSLVTTQSNIEQLGQDMDNIIYEATTINPTLDREDWRDSIRIL